MYQQSVDVARTGFGILSKDYDTVLMPGDLFYSETRSAWCHISPSLYGDLTAMHPTTVFRRLPANQRTTAI